mmetsp:Transcript_12887/g.31305  ORF Transcript_12887/g.31305 Transcript_12887/m.31305 type:complete len:98 (-) Transcript_12887:366-659(-)
MRSHGEIPFEISLDGEMDPSPTTINSSVVEDLECDDDIPDVDIGSTKSSELSTVSVALTVAAEVAATADATNLAAAAVIGAVASCPSGSPPGVSTVS